MTTGKKGIDLIKKYEGLSLKPYLCPANIPTIGYGSTIYPDGTKVSMKDAPITKDRAEEILKFVLTTFERAVNKLVTVPITQNQFDALVSFTYNVGGVHLADSTLLKMLNNGDYAGASEQFGRWAKAGGKTLPGLVARRESEKELFNTKS